MQVEKRKCVEGLDRVRKLNGLLSGLRQAIGNAFASHLPRAYFARWARMAVRHTLRSIIRREISIQVIPQGKRSTEYPEA